MAIEPESTAPPASFEEALTRLETIVQSLEDGQIPLAEALAPYEQGVKLLAQCHGTLERAERRIELLNHVDAAGRERCEPFDDAALSLEEKAQSRTRRRTNRETPIQKADEMDDPGRLFRIESVGAAWLRFPAKPKRNRAHSARRALPMTTQSAPFSLESYASATRQAVDRALDAYTQFPPGCPDSLREPMRYSLLAPGKRLRPMLVLLAADACGATSERAMPAACAVEMVHTYSLIHDDLPAMDDDDLRRGLPTCHKAFGEAQAILAGDALLTLAFEVLADDIQPPAVAARCCGVLARAAGATQLVGGQADDLAGQFSSAGLESLEAIHRRKTGAMFLASLELGGLVAGADSAQLAALARYGECLGLAFQITDDLLDVRGDAQALGKNVGKDSGRGKLTFPGILGIEESVRRAESLVEEAQASVATLEPRAAGLQALAHYVLHRNH